MKKNDELLVAYTSDDNYACFLGISMASLFAHNTDFAAIRVYIMDCGIQEANRARLQAVADSWNREIVFASMDASLKLLDLNMGAHKMPLAAYARLFLPTALPDSSDQLLYLDCDTLICDSLQELWCTDLGDSLIGGVQDTVDKYFQDVIHLPKEYPYLNAGILLINMKAWREENLQQQFLDTIQRFGGNMPFHDQGCINAVCQGRRKLLPVRYNFTSNMCSFSSKTIRRIYFLDSFYSQEELDAAIADPGIVHFTSGLVGRPWEENCTHPQAQAFWDTVKKTPWADLKMRPDSRSSSLKGFILAHKLLPTPVFEGLYRSMSWVLHLRK